MSILSYPQFLEQIKIATDYQPRNSRNKGQSSSGELFNAGGDRIAGLKVKFYIQEDGGNWNDGTLIKPEFIWDMKKISGGFVIDSGKWTAHSNLFVRNAKETSEGLHFIGEENSYAESVSRLNLSTINTVCSVFNNWFVPLKSPLPEANIFELVFSESTLNTSTDIYTSQDISNTSAPTSIESILPVDYVTLTINNPLGIGEVQVNNYLEFIGGSYRFKPGTKVTLVAIPDPGFELASWEGGFIISSRNPFTFIINSDVDLDVYFRKIFIPPTPHSSDFLLSLIDNNDKFNVKVNVGNHSIILDDTYNYGDKYNIITKIKPMTSTSQVDVRLNGQLVFSEELSGLIKPNKNGVRFRMGKDYKGELIYSTVNFNDTVVSDSVIDNMYKFGYPLPRDKELVDLSEEFKSKGRNLLIETRDISKSIENLKGQLYIKTNSIKLRNNDG